MKRVHDEDAGLGGVSTSRLPNGAYGCPGMPSSIYGAVDVDSIDSPTKRWRSTPPPSLCGPLYFDTYGNLAPSTVAPQASNMPGVLRLVPRSAPVRLFLPNRVLEADLTVFLSALAPRVVFIFENQTHRVPAPITAIPELQQLGVIVNHVVPTSMGLPALEDSTAALARECRVLDPLGGGRAAAPCLVYVDGAELKSTIMLGRSTEDIQNAVLRWLGD